MNSFAGQLRGASSFLIIAHRGASKAKRENTLEAFEAAIAMGTDGIEFDVRRTKDGVFVVHHDPAIAGAPSPLCEQAYDDAEDAARTAGFHLPTLEETLSVCKGRIALDIELKEEGYEGDVVPFVRERAGVGDVVFTSFNDASIRETKSLWPEVRTGLILGVGPPASLAVKLSELYPLKRLKESGAVFVAAHFRLLKLGFVRRMRKAGYPVWCWTVDDPHSAKRLIHKGVSGIITNTPDKLRLSLKSSTE